MWFNILKDKWAMFTENILKDKWPTNRKKYVKFSNLDDINQRMVKFYLEKGKHKPQHRKVYVKQILIEMEKSSNARFDLEKFKEPIGQKGWDSSVDRSKDKYYVRRYDNRAKQWAINPHFFGSVLRRYIGERSFQSKLDDMKRVDNDEHQFKGHPELDVNNLGNVDEFFKAFEKYANENKLSNGRYIARAKPGSGFKVLVTYSLNRISLMGFQPPEYVIKPPNTLVNIWGDDEDYRWKKMLRQSKRKPPSPPPPPSGKKFRRRGKSGRRIDTTRQKDKDRRDWEDSK
jgi:hypothetical protein|tara:strand:- start:849 stop:1709 length:861 start_codon:yes stop_codon:yes gene_type:complete